jgi:molybdate-binding protein
MGLSAVDFDVAVSSAVAAGGDAAVAIRDRKHWVVASNLMVNFMNANSSHYYLFNTKNFYASNGVTQFDTCIGVAIANQ